MGVNIFIVRRIHSLQSTFTATNMRGIYYLALFCFMMLFTATKADMVTDDEDMAMGSGEGEDGTTEGGQPELGKTAAVTEKPAEPAPEEKTGGSQEGSDIKATTEEATATEKADEEVTEPSKEVKTEVKPGSSAYSAELCLFTALCCLILSVFG